jgi:hypothetical protein
VNVDEQRRFVAKSATRSLSASSRPRFLIANLELEIQITTAFSVSSIFLIANILRFFILSREGLVVRERGLTLKHKGLISRHPFSSPVTRHSSPVTAVLIETPRLKIRVTSRKQNQSQILIETNQALSAAGSSSLCPPAAPASPQAMLHSATTFRPFPPLC